MSALRAAEAAAEAVYQHTPWAAAAAVLPWLLLAWISARLLKRVLDTAVERARIRSTTEHGLITVNGNWMRSRCRQAAKQLASIIAKHLEKPELLFMLRAVLQGELMEAFDVEDEKPAQLRRRRDVRSD